ncbi:MAG TPA: hypothetical protein VFQ25_02430 [Ktedonobacterales bacterium]|nr:hypothetical protein [Ktedonobacterales bacterium]
MARFRLIRYRRPSLSTLLGVTRAKRRFKTATGYYAATRWLRAPTNYRRRAPADGLLLWPHEIPALPLRTALAAISRRLAMPAML